MRIRGSAFVAGRKILGLLLVAGSLVMVSGQRSVTYSPRDRAAFAPAAAVQFVNPGLFFSIVSAKIAQRLGGRHGQLRHVPRQRFRSGPPGGENNVIDPAGLLSPAGATTSACTACHFDLPSMAHAYVNTDPRFGETCTVR